MQHKADSYNYMLNQQNENNNSEVKKKDIFQFFFIFLKSYKIYMHPEFLI